MNKIYLLLTVSIFLEVIGTANMKSSEGFTNLIPSIIVVVGYSSALVLYIYIVRRAELGIIFAIWSGAGTAIVAIIGMTFFGESSSLIKILGLLLIIIGVYGLNPQKQATE